MVTHCTPPTLPHIKKPRDGHALGDQGEKKKVVSIVAREFEVDSNTSEEMVLSTAKNHLTDYWIGTAMATVSYNNLGT